MECSRVLDKSSHTIQYISVLYDIFTLGCSTFDLDENGTSSSYISTVRSYRIHTYSTVLQNITFKKIR